MTLQCRRRSLVLAAIFSGMPTFATAPYVVSAQTMPNNSAYLSAAVGQQLSLQRQGNLAVRRIFVRCYVMSKMLRARGIDPGNCGATPQSASAAISRLSATQQQYITHTQRDMSATQQSTDNFTHSVIRGCSKLVDNLGSAYWSCPNGTDNTLTGH
jgi:hypothetical protein